MVDAAGQFKICMYITLVHYILARIIIPKIIDWGPNHSYNECFIGSQINSWFVEFM
jgi:hypothetical protein